MVRSRARQAEANDSQQDETLAGAIDQVVENAQASQASQPSQEQPPAQEQPPEQTEPKRQLTQLDRAKAKLDRMVETNKIAFKHQNDLGRIEDELEKFKYTEVELAHIMEPKGTRMIPGFSFSEVERQKQYVNFLASREPKAADGHAAGESNRQDNGQGQER